MTLSISVTSYSHVSCCELMTLSISVTSYSHVSCCELMTLSISVTSYSHVSCCELMTLSISVTSYSHVSCCEQMISKLDRCYQLIDIPVPNTDVGSILDIPLAYLNSCGSVCCNVQSLLS